MNKAKKRVVFITGTRADYGKLKSLIKALEASDKFEVFIFVGGMHLVSRLGSTYEEILKEGYKNVYVAHGLSYSAEMSINLGNTISHITGYAQNIKPDMIVVHGDRIDALAGAIVGALNNITVAHIEGGEVSGTIDESIRHAISKLAHLHFVANEEAKKRIIQLGEQVDNIFVIGSPDIDIMLSGTLPALDKVKQHYGIMFNSYAIVIYHPVTTEYEYIGNKIKMMVDAAIESGKNYVVIYPNNDFGSEIILNEYLRFKNDPHFVSYPSMRFEYFLTLLRNADFMIGNSSAGIREASIYGIPAIDIGTRQQGRYKIGVIKNIQHVEDDKGEILKAIDNTPEYRFQEMHFGNGESNKKFIEIISDQTFWNKKLQKKFVDL